MAPVAQRQELPSLKRPYPGQLWRRDTLQVIVVAVGPSTVTQDDLARGGRNIDNLDAFLATFRRVKR
jgi:hypothetical protein